MADTHLATIPATSLPSPAEWSNIFDMATKLVPTGFLPDSIKTPAQAAAVMLKGRELGIPPMYALSNIVVIKGKPTCGAELMLALIYRDHGDNAVQFPVSTAEQCTIAYRRRGWDKPLTYTFTIQDAQRAGLANSPTWKSYPAPLLRARCISAIGRMAFADTIGGMYGYEELGASVTVVDDQVVLDAESYTIEPADPNPGVTDRRPAPAPHTQIDGQALRDGIVNESKARADKRDYSAIYATGKDKGLKPDDVKVLAYDRYTVQSMTALTDEQLHDYLTYLRDTDSMDLIGDLVDAQATEGK